MRKIIKIIIDALFFFSKDIYETFAKLKKCDFFDIMELIGFGLVINSLYGFFKDYDTKDFFILATVLYNTLKIKHFKKDHKC